MSFVPSSNPTVSSTFPAELIDYEYKRSGAPIVAIIFVIIFGTTFGLIVILAVGAMLGPFWAIGMLVAVIGGGLVIVSIRSEKSTMLRLKEHTDIPLRELLPSLVPQNSFLPEVEFTKIMTVLVAQGRQGNTVRIWRKKAPSPISPLTHLFEPVPADETVPLFIAMEDADVGRVPNVSLSSGQNDRQETARKFKRNVALGGGLSAVCVFGLFSALSINDILHRRRFDPMSIMWFAWFVVAIFGIGGRGAWSWRQQWMLVPGGIVSRRSRLFRAATELHLFKRTESVLIAQAAQQKLWAVHVADAGASQMARMTAREAHLLLRAWLSPIPPPPIEQLSDLQ